MAAITTLPEDLRGYTLIQPWAAAVVWGGKDVENRDKRPPHAMVGQVFAVHAGMGYDVDAEDLVQRLAPPLGDRAHVHGYIIGLARLVAWVRVKGARQAELFGDGRSGLEGGPETADLQAIIRSPWFFGPCGYRLEDVTPLPKPVRCRGMNGWWRVTGEDRAAVGAQL